RTGTTGNDQWRAAEEEFEDAIAGAILRQLPQVEHLSHVEAHGGDDDPVPGLGDVLALVRAPLYAPGIGAEPRPPHVVEPVAGLELEARSIAAGIAAPLAAPLARLHLPGAHQHEVALADLDPLRLGTGIEIRGGNALTIGQRFDALEARHIQQHT